LHQLFLLLMPLPLRSTLFPYTTLFRSPIVHVQQCRTGFAWDSPTRHIPVPTASTIAHSCVTPFEKCSPASSSCSCFRSPSMRRSDRKSTRLNSSHQIISYAVFCLKKKK